MDGTWNPGTPPRRYKARHALRAESSGFNPWLGLGGIAATSGIALSLILASSPMEPDTSPADPAADTVPHEEESPPAEPSHEWETGPVEDSEAPDKPPPEPESEAESKSDSDEENADGNEDSEEEDGEDDEEDPRHCVGDSYEVVSDAFVRNGEQSSTNFGDDHLEVKHRTADGWSRISYLKFDVTQLRECDEVESVKLNVMGYVSDDDGDTTDIGVNATGSAWEEDVITWDNKPGLDGTIRDFTVSGTSAGSWYTVDVTDYVLGSEDDEMSFALYGPADGAENLATVLGDRHSGQGASLHVE